MYVLNARVIIIFKSLRFCNQRFPAKSYVYERKFIFDHTFLIACLLPHFESCMGSMFFSRNIMRIFFCFPWKIWYENSCDKVFIINLHNARCKLIKYILCNINNWFTVKKTRRSKQIRTLRHRFAIFQVVGRKSRMFGYCCICFDKI